MKRKKTKKQISEEARQRAERSPVVRQLRRPYAQGMAEVEERRKLDPGVPLMAGIVEKLKRFRLRVFGQSLEQPEREVGNLDATAAAHGDAGRLDPQGGAGHASFPPNYVKMDDGRPRH